MSSSRTRPLSLALVLALGGLVGLTSTTGCRPRVAAADAGFDQASAEEHARGLERWLEKHPEDADARLELACVYWVHLGAVDRARAHLDLLAPSSANTQAPAPQPMARYAAMTLAHNRADVDAAVFQARAVLRELPAHVRGKDPTKGRQARALSVVAARMLESNLGLRMGDEDAFVALFTELEAELQAGVYPAGTRTQLLSTRASIARARGEDYRSRYDAQGCVREWAVGAVEGHRGALELDRLDAEASPFRVDEGASLTPLACAVRVWNPEPAAGIRRLRTTVEVPGEELRLSIGTQFPARVYVDQALVWASDRSDRFPVASPVVRVPTGPGSHRIEVQTAMPSERAWVLIRATDAAGEPLAAQAGGAEEPAAGGFAWPNQADALERADALVERPGWVESGGRRRKGPKLGLAGPVFAPLRAYLSLEEALLRGDTDAAESLAETLREHDLDGGAFPDAHLLLSEFERLDPTRGRSSSSARQQAELERALELDPFLGRARLSLLELRLGRGETAEVVEAIEGLEGTLEGDAADSIMLWLLAYAAYRGEGSDVQSQRALESAAAVHPANCDVLLARRELARERNQVGVEDELALALAACPGSMGLRARLAVRRQRLDEAEALWGEQLARVPDNLEAMEALAAIAIAAGRYEDAIAWHERMLEFAPYRAVSMVALADLHAQLDQPRVAREFVLAAIERFPHISRLREIGEGLGIQDPLMSWRIEGSEALADYERDRAEGLASEGVSEVLLLDREVSMLLPNGGHRHIVHQMFHILSDSAIDAHGEFDQPGATLLTLHSLKADGRVVEPESIPGKDGLSLRGLEIGDVVEIEFTFDASPEVALPGHVDLGRFRFQSPETPFHRSELITVLPKSEEGRVTVEARNDAPAQTRRELALPFAHGAETSAYVELGFRADRVPRLGSEPASRSMLDELPMVQVHAPLEIQDWLDTLAGELRLAQRSNPELRRLAVEITEQYDNDYDKVDALWRWVVDEVEESGDLTLPATVTLSARQGGRLMLLRAMLEVAGIDSELWLLRDRFGPTVVPGGNPLVETYDTAMLAIPSAGRAQGVPLVVGVSSEVIPLGYLSPSYAGGQAVRVQLEADEATPGYVEVPANLPEYADLRRWELDLDLDSEGNGRLRGRLELRGLEAILWRDAFEQFDADKLPEVFTSAELRRILPIAALDLETLEFENQWELELPLVARFSAKVRNGGVVQGQQLATLAAAVPLDQVTSYAQLPRRWSALVIGYAPVLEAKISVRVDGRSFSEVPGDVDIQGARGRYTRTLVEGGVGESRVVFESRSTLEPGIVEVADYGGLTQFAGQIQSAEQQLLRAR